MVSPFFVSSANVKHLIQKQMGKMKEIAMLIADGEIESLELMTKMAKDHGRSGVFFRGRNLTFQEAHNMIILAHNERNKIRRTDAAAEAGPSSNN